MRSRNWAEISSRIRIGSQLATPSGRARFEVYQNDGERVRIRTLRTNAIISIPYTCFEEALNFLEGKGWVNIGAIHGQPGVRSLDECLQNLTHGKSIASYVATILETASFVEINRKYPAKIRLADPGLKMY